MSSLSNVSNASNKPEEFGLEDIELLVDSGRGARIGLNRPTLENFWASSTLIHWLQVWISLKYLLEMTFNQQ